MLCSLMWLIELLLMYRLLVICRWMCCVGRLLVISWLLMVVRFGRLIVSCCLLLLLVVMFSVRVGCLMLKIGKFRLSWVVFRGMLLLCLFG